MKSTELCAWEVGSRVRPSASLVWAPWTGVTDALPLRITDAPGSISSRETYAGWVEPCNSLQQAWVRRLRRSGSCSQLENEPHSQRTSSRHPPSTGILPLFFCSPERIYVQVKGRLKGVALFTCAQFPGYKKIISLSEGNWARTYIPN